MTRRVAWLLAPLLLLAACTPSDGGDAAGASRAPSPFADCAALTTPPGSTPPGFTPPGSTPPGSGGPSAAPPSRSPGSSAASTDPGVAASPGPTNAASSATGGAGETLPRIELPCFTGGQPVRIGAIRGPAVINVWASWCGPCRKELPAFQRLARRAPETLHVIGVNNRDSREAAQSIGDVTFPNLFDPDERLRTELGLAWLPLTLFVDDQGRIRHVDASGALDDAELAALVQRHLGVAVPA
ncbi:Thiol-disulfide isomerase or thioredoxin [Micromonospora pattaloongensis]|uniref:Thiol-disulfide isomerase or thioredoxin n=1 Tax=Micromonospora pattaloongensis TaxID=405436 RepID=A0A1H3HBZ3_9ACTN|nr:TlpA disulfide reductase family protein [Micromonospora pattaloongensis]SDY12870.1 Thiol-disulfide isomerase or thioredoxin [Micromonospora pattaloongensis]